MLLTFKQFINEKILDYKKDFGFTEIHSYKIEGTKFILYQVVKQKGIANIIDNINNYLHIHNETIIDYDKNFTPKKAFNRISTTNTELYYVLDITNNIPTLLFYIDYNNTNSFNFIYRDRYNTTTIIKLGSEILKYKQSKIETYEKNTKNSALVLYKGEYIDINDLPRDEIINTLNLADNKIIKEIPKGLTIKKLYLQNSSIEKIGSDVEILEVLNLENCKNITDISNIKFGERCSIYLNRSNIEFLPIELKIKILIASDCDIEVFPKIEADFVSISYLTTVLNLIKTKVLKAQNSKILKIPSGSVIGTFYPNENLKFFDKAYWKSKGVIIKNIDLSETD